MKLHVTMKSIIHMTFVVLSTVTTPCIANDFFAYEPNQSAKLRDCVKQSTRPCNDGDSFRASLRNASGGQLQLMKTGSDSTVAIRATWEEVRRQLPKPDENVVVRDPSTSVPVPNIGYFVGFVEGRLNVLAPEWWVSELKASRAYDSESFLLFRETPHVRGPRGLAPEFGIVPQISREGKKDIVIAWGKRCIRVLGSAIPYETFKTGEAFAGIISGERCYIAHFVPFWAYPFGLYCLDCASSKIIWSTRVWCGCSTVLGTRALGHHEVGMVYGNGTLFVFGMDNVTAYVEGFKPSDGTNLLRFSITN